MIISTDTGEVKSGDIVFSSNTSLSVFLIKYGKQAECIIENRPWTSWRISSREKDFFVSQFYGEKLQVLNCAIGYEKDRESSDGESIRKRAHDVVLEKIIGKPPYSYPWGTIESIYDEKASASMIVIRYALK